MPYPEAVIDIHCHAFNARHLPLEGIFRRYHTGKWIARRLASIVNRVTGAVIPAPASLAAADANADREEQAMETFLTAVESAFSPLAARPADAALDMLDVEVDLSVDPLFQELVEVHTVFMLSGESEDAPAAEDLDPEIENREPTPSAASAVADPVREFAAEAVASRALGLTRLFRRALRWLVRKALALMLKKARDWMWEPLKDLAAFISRVISSEASIVESLLDSYGADQRVLLHVHHMMDMKHGYKGKEPFYRYPSQQLARMKAVAQSYPALIGFAAFDPRRDDWQALFEKALEYGFCGFKFYPSMGYLPWDDPDPDVRGKVAAFLAHARSREIPVFAHCSPGGVQAQKGWGLNADPAYWEKALEANDQLRLCFGHGGGGKMKNGAFLSHGWYARNDDEWEHPNNYARKVVELCRKYEHVYCGVGELHEIVTADSWQAASFRTNFLREWRRDTEEKLPWAFADKCVYGSDNYMLKIGRKPSPFLDVFAGLLTNADDFKRFCFYNATNFLDLRSYAARLDSVSGMERQAQAIRDVLKAMGA